MLLGLTLILASLSSRYRVTASITVYSQEPFGVGTTTAAAATYTGAAAYDPTVLNPPPVPSPPPPTQFSIQLQSSSSDVNGLSIPQSGSFLGFSIEFSVINQVREYLPHSLQLSEPDALLVFSWNQLVNRYNVSLTPWIHNATILGHFSRCHS